ARGWLVGDLQADGVAFYGNDWIKGDDGPRFARVLSLKNNGQDEVRIELRARDDLIHTLAWNMAKDGGTPPAATTEAIVEDGKLSVKTDGATKPVGLGDGDKAIAAAPGAGGNIWAIVE